MKKFSTSYLILFTVLGGIVLSNAYGVVVGLYTDSSGNVGIGTTSPSQKLTVVGSGSNTVSINSSTATGPGLILSGGVPFKLRSTSTGDSEGFNKFIITNSSNNINFLTIVGDNGNVGIGVSNPSKKLTIVGNDTGSTPSYLRLANTGTTNGGGAAIEFVNSYGSQEYIANPAARIIGKGVNPSPLQGQLFFQTYRDYSGLQTAMMIESDGSVGIGTITPQHKLDVNGTLRIKIGNNIVYRCTTAGALPVGALTTNSGSCGATVDTGLRVP
ncbi:MAG: hypothetical protein ACREAE_07160 [Nitrosopumilaceae archaeon]